MNSLPSGTWNVEPAATTVTIAVKKLLFLSIPMELTTTSGSISVNGDGAVSAVEINVDAGSVASGNAKRDNYVKGADFLHVDKYPEILFAADRVTTAGEGFVVNAAIQRAGMSSNVTLDVQSVSVSADRGTFVASGSVDRRDIGLTKLPSFVIGNELQIDIQGSFQKS